MSRLTYQHAVDEVVFVHVVHGIADVCLFHHPAGREQHVGDEDIEVLVLVGTVALTFEGGVENKENLTVLMEAVIGIEHRYQHIDGVVLHIE